MSKQKRFMTLMLAVCVIISIFAGCSKKSESGSTAASTATPASTKAAESPSPSPSTAPELKPYEVSIYMPGSVQKDQALVEQRIAELLKDKIPNTTVKLNYIDWGAYQEKTNLMLQSGETMDLLFSPEWYQFFPNTAKGAFLPLADDSLETYGNLLDTYGKGIKETIDPTYLLAPVVNGKLYAIPTNKELAQGRALAFRKDIVEKYKFDLSTVKELKDIEPFLQVIKEKEPNIYPVYSNKQDSILDWLQDYGFQGLGNGTYINRSTENGPVISVTDPEFTKNELANYKLLNDWFKKGYLNKTAATTQEKFDDVKSAGKVWVQSTSTSPGREAAMRNPNKSGAGPEFFEWTLVNLQSPLVTTTQATGSQMAIPRSSKDPARAMMVLDLLYTDKELINTVVFGLQDKHFTKVSDNKIKQVADSGYNPGNAWIIGNQLNNYLLDNEADNKYEEYVQFNKTAERSPLLGFVFNPEPVKTQISAFSTVNTEFRDILRTGTVDPEPILKKRNEKYATVGIDAIVKEVQKQLDEWKVANGK